ncbi:MAG: hypothetical protein CVU03_00090 [Bacteroidetes bacterium HGW-Bacteroidetes-2]|jgi:hypothetical protein|nr:MAG: hypothetical protein CVU03_00090 [Bacteroidetes bacterium HGW-Bacteroidetes-2]
MTKHLFYILLCLCFPLIILGQESLPKTEIDSLYREDQFYIGLTYNILTNRPDGIRNEGFSGGFHFGFLRDMPINNTRNIAIAAGLGYAINKYGYNMFIGKEESGNTNFLLLDENFTFETNRFVTHEIELPIEFRWRTSIPEDYRFWRIYGGVKLGYVFYHKATFIQKNNKIQQTAIPEYDKFRTSLFLNFGYNSVNFQVQYSLNSFFNKDATLGGAPIDLNTIKIGLIFYVL